MKNSIIRDLIYKIEGFGTVPEHNIESIVRLRNGRIVIVIREPQADAAETGQTQSGTTDGEQTEQGGAE
ncbi:MAG: hypothetical protein J1D88_08930 [Treponema sp.]|nr:hypothetical protein [Treponema sp.]